MSPPLVRVKRKKSDHHGTAEDEVFTATVLQPQEAIPKHKKGVGQTRKCVGLYEDEECSLYWILERRDELQEDSCQNNINTKDEGSSPLQEHNRKGRKQADIQVESESRQQRS